MNQNKGCKHYRSGKDTVPVLGGNTSVDYHICMLKRTSDVKMHEVYAKLFQIGREGSLVTESCPFGESADWKQCPFFE